MRAPLLDLIRCPACQGTDLSLSGCISDGREIRSGQVNCLTCRQTYAIEAGILDLLASPSETILSEVDGWTKMEKFVTNTDELMLALPDDPSDPTWKLMASNYHFIWEKLTLTGTERVLDLGSGRCWSTRDFARQGCSAVGLDILKTRYVGLLTADIYLQQEGVYFERVCGDMNQLAFRDGIFDLVFVTATLHHTSSLAAVCKEIYRVLKPGGRLVMINEPVARLGRKKKLEYVEVQLGINEHVYWLWEYLGGLHKVGFRYRLYPFIGSYQKFLAYINNLLFRAFPGYIGNVRVWPPILYAHLLLKGGSLNLIANKPHLD